MAEKSSPKERSEEGGDNKHSGDDGRRGANRQPVRRCKMGMRTRINGRNRVTQTSLLRALMLPPVSAPGQMRKQAAE
jgi:hypothetical protein